MKRILNIGIEEKYEAHFILDVNCWKRVLYYMDFAFSYLPFVDAAFASILLEMETKVKQFIFRYSCMFVFVCLMMFSATFNNISVILWLSVLLVEVTGGPGENHRPVVSD